MRVDVGRELRGCKCADGTITCVYIHVRETSSLVDLASSLLACSLEVRTEHAQCTRYIT